MIKVLNDLNSTEVKNYWKVTGTNDETFPYLLIDKWYNPEELEGIWKELDFYQSCPDHHQVRTEDRETPVARELDGLSRSSAYRFHLWDVYSQNSKGYHYSHILRCRYKQRSPEFHKLVEKHLPIHFLSFAGTNTDGTMVSYYEDGDYYKPHIDSMMFTCLIWVFKEPKQFKGGEFVLPQAGVTIPMKNNRMILFPSYYTHAVNPVKFDGEKNQGLGRYTITHFYNWEGRND